MDETTRTFIQIQLLTITEVARLLGKSEAATTKEAYRKRWDYVKKGRQKLYFRGDFGSIDCAPLDQQSI